MSAKRTVVIGMLALAALTGCATSGAVVANDPNRASEVAGQASPATTPSSLDSEASSICADGWYDRVAGACDDMGQ